MLIGLNFKPSDTDEFKEELGVALAKECGGRTRVFEPTSSQEYLDTLKAYNPAKKDNLVIIGTHVDSVQMETGLWRATDIAFNQKGGVLFGETPKDKSTAFKTKIPADNLAYIANSAAFYQVRAIGLKKSVRDYVGRADSDPHTLVLGFSPSWPRLSVTANALISGLPAGGDEGPWWWGVGCFNHRNKAGLTAAEAYTQVLEEFPYAARVVVSDVAQVVMDDLEEPYQRAGDVRFRTLPEGVKYGKELRSLARLDSERVVE